MTRFIPYSENQILTISCVAHHTLDSIIAISHFGKNLPILVYKVENDKDNGNIFKNISVVQNDAAVRVKSTSTSLSKINYKKILLKMDEVVILHNAL